MTNSPDVGIFAKQLRQLGVNADWIGSTSRGHRHGDEARRRRLMGRVQRRRFSSSDANDESRSYAKRYRAKYNADPDLYSGWAYGGVYLLKHAIEKAKSTEPEAIRGSAAGDEGIKGRGGGHTTSIRTGDGVHGYNVVRNEKGKVAFIKHIEFDQ